MEKNLFGKKYPGLKVKELNLLHVSNGRRMYCYTTCLGGVELKCCSGPGWIWCVETGGECRGSDINFVEPTVPFDPPEFPPLDSFKPVKPPKGK